MYLILLCGLALTCLIWPVHALRAFAEDEARRAQSGEGVGAFSAVVALVGVALILFLFVVLVNLLKFLLELIEYLAIRRRPCARCGERRWSWGFTRGFGL